jgi:hypothetical protein
MQQLSMFVRTSTQDRFAFLTANFISEKGMLLRLFQKLPPLFVRLLEPFQPMTVASRQNHSDVQKLPQASYRWLNSFPPVPFWSVLLNIVRLLLAVCVSGHTSPHTTPSLAL